jgi:hypothetical protein
LAEKLAMLDAGIYSLCAAVSFAIPDMATVTEGGLVSICAQMTSTSVAATLGMEVVLTLFTTDGTGVYYKTVVHD